MASPDGLLQVPQIYTVIMQVEHKIRLKHFFGFPLELKHSEYLGIKVTIKLSVFKTVHLFNTKRF